MRLRTPLCELLGIEYPIILAGMGGASVPELAAAVSEAGGLGVLGAASCPPHQLDEWIAQTRSLTDKPFGVDTLLPASVPSDHGAKKEKKTADGAKKDVGHTELKELVPAKLLEFRDRFMEQEGLPRKEKPAAGEKRVTPQGGRMTALTQDFFKQQIEVILDNKVPVYAAGLGAPSEDFIKRGHSIGMKFMGVAGKVRHAQKMAASGVDFMVAQGSDGGGHNTPIGTMALIPQVVDAANGIPVVGAGGIADGRGIAAALMLGAVGVWVGTRFLATLEANIPHYQKLLLIERGSADTMVSKAMSGKPARMMRAKWPEVYERGEIEALPMPFQAVVSTAVIASAEANERGDIHGGVCGQALDLIHDMPSAQEVFQRMVKETVERLAGIKTLPGVEVSF